MQFLTLMKSVDGILFIKLKLKQIMLKKELFLLDVEQGDEVLIPHELSMEQFPLSFWYYDFILNYLTENVQDEIRDQILFQTTFQFEFFQRENLEMKLYRMIGWHNPEIYLSSKLVVKHAIVNHNENKNINQDKSHHTQHVQKSKFI